MDQLWPNVLAAIEKRVNPKNFHTWFKPLQFIESKSDSVFLGVPDRFTRDWLNDHGLKDIVQQEFSDLLSREIRVVLRVIESVESSEPKTEIPETNPKSHNEKKHNVRESGLNPRNRFDDFVVGTSNQLAYAASKNVSENPGTTYNPLFIYGGSGLGKTHLLNAIGHQILNERPSSRLIYTTSETFVNELINSIRFMTMDRFRSKYRSSCDVLLIDDIQFISKKVRTQEEFFHTFNTLYESHRQIVLTSDSYPQDIPELEDRLRTRFQWGLIADIQPPEIETRIAILQKKAELEGLDIPEDVAMYIASLVKSNIRELEGSLKRLGAFSSMYGTPITLDLAKDVLKDIIGTNNNVSIDDIQKAVASFFNVKLSDLKGNRRYRSISRPRQIAMYICRNHLESSFPEIGTRFNKDHSTAISACNNIKKLIKTDSSVKEAVEAIIRQMFL